MAIKSITIDEDEEASLNQLLDVALRQAGIGALKAARHWASKLENAKLVPEEASQEEGPSTSEPEKPVEEPNASSS